MFTIGMSNDIASYPYPVKLTQQLMPKSCQIKNVYREQVQYTISSPFHYSKVSHCSVLRVS